MISPLEVIGSSIDDQCLADKIDKNGCSVGLELAPTPLKVVDLDHPEAPVRTSAVKCDYLLFAPEGKAGLWVVPVELKSSAVNPGRVSAQLQAGAKAAEQLTKGISPVTFVPVVARAKKGHRRQYQELRKRRIVYRNEEHPIELMYCGTPLTLFE